MNSVLASVRRVLLLAPLAACASSPETLAWDWSLQESGTDASLRGVSAVDAQVGWASGSSGTWLRTVDGGGTWTRGRIAGAEEIDFRDIEAFDAQRAVVLSAGAPARIYRTIDGGVSWDLCHEDEREGIFLDALAFSDEDNGMAFGDPIDGRLVVLRTEDGGESWSPVPEDALPPALDGEAGFAASGTCLYVRASRAWIGLGGETESAGARLFHSSNRGRSWTARTTPLASGRSSGIFSIDFFDDELGLAVGGDYQQPDNASSNALLTRDGGETWTPLQGGAAPRGYRSAVAFVPGTSNPAIALAVGTSGADYFDGERFHPGMSPSSSVEGLNAVSFSPQGVGWAVGADGKIAFVRLRREPPGSPLGGIHD